MQARYESHIHTFDLIARVCVANAQVLEFHRVRRERSPAAQVPPSLALSRKSTWYIPPRRWRTLGWIFGVILTSSHFQVQRAFDTIGPVLFRSRLSIKKQDNSPRRRQNLNEDIAFGEWLHSLVTTYIIRIHKSLHPQKKQEIIG